MFSIGEISRRANVKVPTIRYYEQQGLLAIPERSAGNQRRYTKEQLQQLSFIRHSRDLGLSIPQIRELIELSHDPEKPCNEAHNIATNHLVTIREKIQQLSRLESELVRITTKCKNKHIGECYVIQSLCNHDLCKTEH